MSYGKQIQKVTDALIGTDAKRATVFLAPNLVVRATRRRYRRGPRKSDPVEIFVTIGRPNYLERDMVKDFKRAGEPFPVKKVQIKGA